MDGLGARITVPCSSISRALAGKRYGTGVSGRAQDDPLVVTVGVLEENLSS